MKPVFAHHMAKYAGIILATLSLMACSDKYEIQVMELESGTPLFRFVKSLLAPPVGKSAVVVRRIEVAERLSGNQTDSVWRVASDAPEGLDLHEARYGKLPTGFSEQLKSQPLKSGREYVVVVQGPGEFGMTTFVMP